MMINFRGLKNQDTSFLYEAVIDVIHKVLCDKLDVKGIS